MIDEETTLYEIYGILQKENLLEDWKMVSSNIMDYFVDEWGYDNPPTTEEIIEVIEYFVENSDTITNIQNVLTDEEFEFLLHFMVAGFDIIINGEEEKEEE